MKSFIYTIGHSTRTAREFIDLLKAYKVKELADVRTIPKSRHNPQFNEKRIARSLKKAGIRYVHMGELGGLRHAKADSKNLGWRNLSFRGYADYMATPEFEKGLKELERLAKKKKVAIMCAEALPWRCHRSLISDALIKSGWNVFNIMTIKSAPKHTLTSFAKMLHGRLFYPKQKSK